MQPTVAFKNHIMKYMIENPEHYPKVHPLITPIRLWLVNKPLIDDFCPDIKKCLSVFDRHFNLNIH